MSVISKWSLSTTWHEVIALASYVLWCNEVIQFLICCVASAESYLLHMIYVKLHFIMGNHHTKCIALKEKTRKNIGSILVYTLAQNGKTFFSCTLYNQFIIFKSNHIQVTNRFSMLSKIILAVYLLIIINIQNYQTWYLDCCLNTPSWY